MPVNNPFLQPHNIIENLPIATALFEGIEMKLVSVNEAMLKLWGREKSITGSRLLDFMPELKEQKFPGLLKEVYETGNPHYEYDAAVYIQVEGALKEIFMDYTYNALKDSSGNIYGILVTALDVTERILSKKKLQESEQNFRNLVLHAPVAMCVLKGPRLQVEIANERIFELWGKKPEEVTHKPIFEGLPEAREQGLEEILQHVYTTGNRFIADERPVNLLRNGKIETTYINFVYEALYETDEKITGVMAVAVEVTDQVEARHKVEEAEERARLAIEAADVGTFDLNLESHEMITSARLDTIFGIEEPADHRDYVAKVHPEDKSVREKAHAEALKTGKLFYEVRLLTDNNSIKWVRAEGKVHYVSSKPSRMLGTMTDITSEKNIRQQKDDFIGIASHELKTPMTSLKASLQLLTRNLKNELTPAAAALLNQSNSSLAKLGNLIEDLLNVTRINEGQLSIHKTKLNVAKLTNGCCNHIKSTGFDIIYEGDLDLQIYADMLRIEQVLINMLNNAVKYAPNSKTIVVKAEKLPGFVKISVIDRGPGIPTDKIPHIFERYYQADNKGVQFAGLGLGLYISAQIINRHGGKIGVGSEPGKGSTFWFTIPEE
ncbi:ATP-binding protein [Rubrolithibacter danxiaensis]|uniref:sensor histidine kinase n=1 Tax=Rubrolithibacter danxiaensis TaxID=3390805 RepID=UPI003BF87EF5